MAKGEFVADAVEAEVMRRNLQQALDAVEKAASEAIETTVLQALKNARHKICLGITFLTTQEKGMVDAVVNPKHHYTLVAEKEGYLKSSFNDLDPTQKTYTAFLNKKTMNKAIEIKNIYYEFNKAAIVENAKPNLEKLVFILTENPELIIELGSHTDSRGSDEYNRELSQKRAESVVQYLVNSGISQKRMVAKGYGESQLANNCTNTAICSEEDHAKNRRTEFKIIGIDNLVILTTQVNRG
jgi:outer membrane protein OmpA-like peptidoglycan-associated protein